MGTTSHLSSTDTLLIAFLEELRPRDQRGQRCTNLEQMSGETASEDDNADGGVSLSSEPVTSEETLPSRCPPGGLTLVTSGHSRQHSMKEVSAITPAQPTSGPINHRFEVRGG